MPPLNFVHYMGWLAFDPDVKEFEGGTRCTALVNQSSKFTIKNGEEKTKFASVRLEAWGKIGEILASYGKGDQVIIAGEIQTRSWEKDDGKKEYFTFVRPWNINGVAGRVGQDVAEEPDEEEPFV
jgi:single-strand DNA-binding protein